MQNTQIEKQLSILGQFSLEQNKKLLSSIYHRIHKNYTNETWNLSDRKFRDINAKQFFNVALKIHGKILMADYNKNPSIINEIARPIYCSLNTLFLGDNNITSIQSLTFMNLPELRFLYLNDNHISYLKSFSKCHFPLLEYVSLNGNKIVECQQLQKLQVFNIKKFKMTDQIPDNKSWEVMNVLWLMKTSFNQKQAQIFFNSKFIVTPQIFLFKLKLRKRKYVPPSILGYENSPSCSPLPFTD